MEVYYSTKNAAYDSQSKIFGLYTTSSEKVNGRYFYQSNFENGKYGIWLCGSEREWYISDNYYKGQCFGNARSQSTNFCLEEIGWNFLYFDNSWKNAKEGLGIRCICSNSDSRGNFIYTD